MNPLFDFRKIPSFLCIFPQDSNQIIILQYLSNRCENNLTIWKCPTIYKQIRTGNLQILLPFSSNPAPKTVRCPAGRSEAKVQVLTTSWI